MWIILGIHFLIISAYHMPDNPIKHQYKKQINAYINPFFTQEWKLFAPNPIASNMSILYRFLNYKDGLISDDTGWLDPSIPFIEERRDKFWSPSQRVLKYFSSSYMNIIETYDKASEYSLKIDSISQDSVKTKIIITKMIESSLGHIAVNTYARFILNKVSEENNWTNTDSILFQYKILDSSFPRFSKREEDYFDLSNYTFRELKSEFSKIK